MPTPSAKEGLDAFQALRLEFQAEVEKLSARVNALEFRCGIHIDVADGNDGKVQERDADDGSIHDEDRLKHPFSTVPFEESAWNYPVVIGLADAGPWDVFFSVLLLLLNMSMQFLFSTIILGDSFMGEEFTNRIEEAKRWRTSFAHDYKHVDLSDTSLVTRVCSGDGSLILSTRQATLVEHINSYLGLNVNAFETEFFQPGKLLCILCITLWTFCIYKELRNTWLSFEAVHQLPRSSRTMVRDNTIISLSKKRYGALLLTYVLRFSIASVLMSAGVRWLARTTSISELMLNAVALNAILDVDEFLFAAFTPLALQVAIQHLEPMKVKYTQRRSQFESACLFLVLISTFLLPFFGLLEPLGETMLAVKRELCGGNQTFVVGQNSDTQMILGYPTESTRGGSLSVLEMAVRQFYAADPGTQYITFTSGQQFESERTRSMEQETREYVCLETQILQSGGDFYNDPVLTQLTLTRLATAGASLGRFDLQDCASAADLCDRYDARLLRLVCGDTCACSDPLAWPWFHVPSSGCADSCSRAIMQRTQCQDAPNDMKWQEMWDRYMPSLNAIFGGSLESSPLLVAAIQQSVAQMKSGGCATLAHPQFGLEVGGQRTWCEGDSSWYRPLAHWCPVTCGCTSAQPPAYCPTCS